MTGALLCLALCAAGYTSSASVASRVAARAPPRRGAVAMSDTQAAANAKAAAAMSNTQAAAPAVVVPALEESLPGQVISAMFPAGKRVVNGVFTEDVDPSSVPDEVERERRRSLAATAKQNIDAAERERRQLIGQAGAICTVLYAGGLLAVGAGPAARATVFFPLALSVGFLESASSGL